MSPLTITQAPNMELINTGQLTQTTQLSPVITLLMNLCSSFHISVQAVRKTTMIPV